MARFWEVVREERGGGKLRKRKSKGEQSRNNGREGRLDREKNQEGKENCFLPASFRPLLSRGNRDQLAAVAVAIKSLVE